MILLHFVIQPLIMDAAAENKRKRAYYDGVVELNANNKLPCLSDWMVRAADTGDVAQPAVLNQTMAFDNAWHLLEYKFNQGANIYQVDKEHSAPSNIYRYCRIGMWQ
jgi:hypothetical protein